MHGSVDLYVEDAITMKHGSVHSYFFDMEDVSSSAYDGGMKASQTISVTRRRRSLECTVPNEGCLLRTPVCHRVRTGCPRFHVSGVVVLRSGFVRRKLWIHSVPTD